MVKDLLQIGNRIDICPMEKLEKKEVTGEKVPILSSQLEDIENSGELVVQMPTYKGKIILLSLGARYEFIFYTRKGPYRGVCQVADRYKEDDRFMVRVELKSGLNKFQRREYFRLGCFLEMESFELTRKEALDMSSEELEELIRAPEVIMTESKAVIVDISGGGVRFISEKKFEDGDYAAVQTRLTNENVYQHILVPVSIVSCRQASPNMERYETRAEFLHLSTKLRELIIKYIFDEDRKIRKKDMGV